MKLPVRYEVARYGNWVARPRLCFLTPSYVIFPTLHYLCFAIEKSFNYIVQGFVYHFPEHGSWIMCKAWACWHIP